MGANKEILVCFYFGYFISQPQVSFNLIPHISHLSISTLGDCRSIISFFFAFNAHGETNTFQYVLLFHSSWGRPIGLFRLSRTVFYPEQSCQ